MRIEAKNLGDAYKKAIDELNCSVTELDIKVVQYPSSGFLGFFKKNAIIEVTRENGEKSHKAKRDVSEKGEQNQGHHKQSDVKIGKKSGLNVQKRDHKNHKDKSDDVRHEQGHKSRQNFLNEQNTALAQAAFADSSEDARRQSEQTKSEYVIKRIDTDGADENLGENLSEKKPKISPMKNILDTSILDNFNQEKACNAFKDERKKEQKEPINFDEILPKIRQDIKRLFAASCFEIDKIEVSKFSDDCVLVELDGADAALLIGKEGYRYKAISYMLFSWLNFKYSLTVRLEIAQFFKNQEAAIEQYLIGVIERIETTGRAQTKPLDGVLVKIALEKLRERFPDKYVAVKTGADGKFVVVNEFYKK